MDSKKIKTIVFPVAGLGTRMLLATKSVPKEMLPVFCKPLIHYAFEEAQKVGVEKFIFITGRNKNAIEDYFDINYELEHKLKLSNNNELLKKTTQWLPKPGQVIFLRQQEPLGLGHAILCAKNVIQKDEPFFVSLPDELFYAKDSNPLQKMIDIYNKCNGSANVVSVKEMKREEISKYGVISIEKDFDDYCSVNKLVEKPKIEEAPSNFAITGRYILDYNIFSILENIKPGHNNEIQLTDAIQLSLNQYKTYAYKMRETRFDCGNAIGYLQANISFALLDEKTRDNTIKLIEDFYNALKK